MHESLLPREFPGGRLRRLRPADREAFQAYRGIAELGRYRGMVTDVRCRGTRVPCRDEPGATVQAGRMGATRHRGTGFRRSRWRHRPASVRGWTRRGGRVHARAISARPWHRCACGGRSARATMLATTEIFQVLGITDARNLASVRLLERLGFKHLATRQVVFHGEPCSEKVYALARKWRPTIVPPDRSPSWTTSTCLCSWHRPV